MNRNLGAVAAGFTAPHQVPVAWANFNGLSGGSIRASFNITSITRSTTGTYTVTSFVPLAATEYITIANSVGTLATGSGTVHLQGNVQNTLNSVVVENRIGTSALRDWDIITLAFMGRY